MATAGTVRRLPETEAAVGGGRKPRRNPMSKNGDLLSSRRICCAPDSPRTFRHDVRTTFSFRTAAFPPAAAQHFAHRFRFDEPKLFCRWTRVDPAARPAPRALGVIDRTPRVSNVCAPQYRFLVSFPKHFQDKRVYAANCSFTVQTTPHSLHHTDRERIIIIH